MDENTEIQPVASNRERFSERMRGRHPELDLSDEEALFGQIGADYDEYERDADGYRSREKGLVEAFDANPYAAHFISDLAHGKDPWCGLIERIGIDGMTDLINDPMRREAFAAANAKFVEDVAKDKELEAEYAKNAEASLALFREYSEQGVSDEEIDSAADLLKRIANEVLVGKFSRENMEMAFQMLHRERDLAAADREGEVRGRNARIQEMLRRPEGSDGVPALAGSNIPERDVSNPRGIFGVADQRF